MSSLIGFHDGSRGAAALAELRRSIRLAALRAAELARSDWLESIGHDQEAIAMVLLVELLKRTPVRKLFEPTEADFHDES